MGGVGPPFAADRSLICESTCSGLFLVCHSEASVVAIILPPHVARLMLFESIFGVTAFGFNPSEPQALIVDSGNRSFSTTTRATVGLAVARLLAKPAETANRSIYVSSVQTTTNELITAYKKAANKVDLSVKHSSSEEQMRVAKEYIATGESMLGQATFGIVVSAGENAKSDFEAERLLDNELLGLPIESVDQLVAGFLQERS